uniref:BEACH-type PH domain-containing protein n=1 Tax=Heligmosomoides polygyrus TaxID=6339 RepID=A0A183G9A3_HELPZ
LLCKVHMLEVFHPEIAKTMDPANTEEDEHGEIDDDDEFAVSSKPKQLQGVIKLPTCVVRVPSNNHNPLLIPAGRSSECSEPCRIAGHPLGMEECAIVYSVRSSSVGSSSLPDPRRKRESRRELLVSSGIARSQSSPHVNFDLEITAGNYVQAPVSIGSGLDVV